MGSMSAGRTSPGRGGPRFGTTSPTWPDRNHAPATRCPGLVSALDRLEAVFEPDDGQMTVGAVGTQGNRVIRLSAGAAEALLEQDAADVAEIAAAAALFSNGFRIGGPAGTMPAGPRRTRQRSWTSFRGSRTYQRRWSDRDESTRDSRRISRHRSRVRARGRRIPSSPRGCSPRSKTCSPGW